MSRYVDHFFLVSNGAEVPEIREAAEALPNVTICAGPLGAGWAEAARYCLTPTNFFARPPRSPLR
jgi:hypothetical protein